MAFAQGGEDGQHPAQQQQQQITAMLESLSSMDTATRLQSVRDLKNSIIGNKTKKQTLLRYGALPKLVDLLNSETDPQLLVQAAAAIGSFACGAEENVEFIVRADAIRALCRHISSSNVKVVEASVRSLKLIYQWDRSPREIMFEAAVPSSSGSNNVIAQLISLASSDSNSNVIIEVTCALLARLPRSREQQNAIDNAGGIEKLVAVLFSSYPKAQEAALDSISAIARDNRELSFKIAGNEKVMSHILRLIKDRRPSIRLLAVDCCANLYCMGTMVGRFDAIMSTVLPMCVKLLGEQDSIREEAPLVLSHLVRDSEDLQKAACDADAVTKLVSFLSGEASNDRTKENALVALATLSSLLEDCRKLVIDAKVLPLIVSCLEHPNERVREAACSCTRSLSRSVKHLRTSLVDAGIATPLFKLLNDPSTVVKSSVAATLCNIVLDFSPMKKLVIENDAMQKLVNFTQSMDSSLRLNSIWALKNLVFRADSSVKEAVMKAVTYPALLRLLTDPESEIQEQAMNFVRNLVYGDAEDITSLLKGGGNTLIDIIEDKLGSENVGLVLQTLYVICNIGAGTAKQKQTVLRPTILKKIAGLMSHPNKDFRTAAVWCLINFTWKDDNQVEERIHLLKDMGFEDLLKQLKTDSDIDVRERAKHALHQFGSGGRSSPSSNGSGAH